MMERFKQQAARFGATFVPGDATRVDFSSRPLRVWTAEQELQSRAVIVATGASPLELGLPGEKEYAGRGVSYCGAQPVWSLYPFGSLNSKGSVSNSGLITRFDMVTVDVVS